MRSVGKAYETTSAADRRLSASVVDPASAESTRRSATAKAINYSLNRYAAERQTMPNGISTPAGRTHDLQGLASRGAKRHSA